jgi:6-phosphogluconolactonase
VTPEVLADAEAAARRGAEVIADASADALSRRDRFSLAVSGGHAPWRMFELLGEHDLDWGRIDVFQVDERLAPDGDPDRNLVHLEASLPAAAAGAIRPMAVTDDDPEASAARYAASLPDALDLVHLGLGPDGHTASLIPGDPVLEVTDRPVATTGEYQGRRRMTLTYPALAAARRILWLVTGADKPEALAKLRAGDDSIPAGRVEARGAILIADAAAAGDPTPGASAQ